MRSFTIPGALPFLLSVLLAALSPGCEGSPEDAGGSAARPPGLAVLQQALDWGDCCTPHASPGCSGTSLACDGVTTPAPGSGYPPGTIAGTVCSSLLSCCDQFSPTGWDAFCVGEAVRLCHACTFSDGFCSGDEGETCSNSPVDCACPPGEDCQAGVCVPSCQPSCDGIRCSDGCGGVCPTCSDGDPCTEDDTCQGLQCVGTLKDCADADPCTQDLCDAGTGACLHLPKDCSDGNACTTDACDAATGACTHTTRTCRSDGNPCTLDACSPATGLCGHEPRICPDDGDPCTLEFCSIPDGGACLRTPASCDDGDPCSVDRCDSALGLCVNEPLDCPDDGDPCTLDSCDPVAGECGHPPRCDDRDPCTEDLCDPDTLACSFPELDCDDGDPATADSCDPQQGGCVHLTPCDDGDACTVDGWDPAAQACRHDPRDCDDGNACTADSCDVTLGCQHGPPCATDQFCRPGFCADPTASTFWQACMFLDRSCDDGDLCTDDHCSEAEDRCVHTKRSCTNDVGCTHGVCDPATGQCRYLPGCDDGDPCTTDYCDFSPQRPAGACVFLPDCDDRNPCTVDRCDVDSGCIHEGKDCDDGNACTVDFCNLFDGTGACDHVPASCVDGDPCTEDTCDPLLGCLWEPVDCPDDGDPCTLARCDPEAGGCTLSPACDDGDPCTVDTCDPGTGACTDSPRICPDDGNPCTAEACAPSTGECTRSPLDEGPCNDQDGCTLDDRCVAGLCTGDPDPACDPPTLDLGSPIGVMTFPVLQPDGCWRGEQQLPGCEGLTGCRVTGVACPGGQGEIQSVELSAEAQLTLLGSAPVSGQWNAAGWCLRASLAPERFGSLAEQLLAPPEATVCRLQGGELVQSVRLARWQPFPFDPETVLEGVPVVARTVDPLTGRASLVVSASLGDYRPLGADAPPSTVVLQEAVVRASGNEQGEWETTLAGELQVQVASLDFLVDVEAPVEGKETLQLSGRHVGSLPLPGAAGDPCLMDDPQVAVALVFAAQTPPSVQFAGSGHCTLFGQTVELAGVQGGGTLGAGSALAVSARTTASGTAVLSSFLARVGITPLSGDLCLALSSADRNDELLCALPARAGVRLLADQAQLPIALPKRSTVAPLELQIAGGDHLLARSVLPLIPDVRAGAHVEGETIPFSEAGLLSLRSLSFSGDMTSAAGQIQGTLRREGRGEVQNDGRVSTVAGTVEVDVDDRPLLWRATLDGRYKLHPAFALQDPLLEVLLDPERFRIRALGYEGPIHVLLAGEWPADRLDLPHLGVARATGIFYTGLLGVYALHEIPWVFSLHTSDLEFADVPRWSKLACDLVNNFNNDITDKCIEHSFCEEEICLSGIKSIYPFSFDLSELNISYSLHPDFTDEWLSRFEGTWMRDLKLELSGFVRGTDKKMTFLGQADQKKLALSARSTPSKYIVTSLFSESGFSITNDPINKVVRSNKIGPMFEMEVSDPMGRKPWKDDFVIEAWIESDTWDPPAVLMEWSDNTNKAIFTVKIKGDPGKDGKVDLIYEKQYTNSWDRTIRYGFRTMDPVVPRNRWTHIAVHAHDLGQEKLHQGVIIDGRAVRVEPIWEEGRTAEPTTHIELGKGLRRIDDLRFWWAESLFLASSPAYMSFLPALLFPPSGEAYMTLPAGWWEFDRDGPVGPWNRGGGSRARDLALSFRAPAIWEPWTPEDDVRTVLFFTEQGGFAQTFPTGLWIRSGVGVDLPLGIELPLMRQNLHLGDGRAEGDVWLASPIPLVQPHRHGRFVVGVRSPALPGGQSAFLGPEARIDLLSRRLEGQATLVFENLLGLPPQELLPIAFSWGCPAGEACLDLATQGRFVVDQTAGAAGQSVRTTFLNLGSTLGAMLGIQLDGPQPPHLFTAGPQDPAGSVPLQVAGRLQAVGRSFASTLIQIFEDRITFASKVALPDRFGLSFGETELALELKLGEGTLCGAGRNAATGCDMRVCFRGPTPNDVDLSVTCDGRQGCTADEQCPAGKVCYGFFCVTPLRDDSFCTRAAECASGHCAVTCYTPASRGQGQVCNPAATGQCREGLVCAGAICLPRVGYGLVCTDSAQCDAGQTCQAVSGGSSAGRLGGALIEVRRCLYPAGSRALNETCSQGRECGSGKCELGTGRCTCTAEYCNTPPREGVYVPPQYCDVDRQCKRKQADGKACCGNDQCLGGRCTVPVCARLPSGTPVAQGSCYTPGTAVVGSSCLTPEHCASNVCLLGVCRCASRAHCPGQRCSFSLLDGTAGDCVALRQVGEGCNPLRPEECTSGRCAGYLAPAVCYQAGARSYGQSCMANDHCRSGRCQLDCRFDLTGCSPLNLAGLDPAACGCSPRCECSVDEDCGDRQYCGSLEVLGRSFGDLKRCRDRKGDGDACTRDGQCRDNECSCSRRCIGLVCVNDCRCD